MRWRRASPTLKAPESSMPSQRRFVPPTVPNIKNISTPSPAAPKRAASNTHCSIPRITTTPPHAGTRKKHFDSITPVEYPDFLLTSREEFWRVLADAGSFILNIKDKVVDGVRHRYVWKTIMGLSDLGWRCVDDYLWIK